MYIEEYKKITEFIRKNNIKYNRISTWIKMKCDNCDNIFKKEAHNISPKRRTNDYKHYCGNCGNVFSLASKNYYEMNLDRYKHLIGNRIIDSHGYMTIYLGNTHKYSKGYCGRYREHVSVMENFLCRNMEKGEVVHHIDGNKLNNDISNLDVCSIQEHNNCHAKIEKIVFELYKLGIIEYNRETKLYKY